ncbi:MAG: acyltransferase family protein, partial [Planctomycetaceae bacterium]|nr:acyltransferase family protein [Planctomycetaceae bacterium]
MTSPSAQIPRRHDLDALRAMAMLLGIVLHGLISFMPGAGVFWGVQDIHTSPAFGVLMAAIHGWRMPLFFLVSGFFTAMLWRKRGLKALVWHRFRRILVPML